jgi:hypothetical protein
MEIGQPAEHRQQAVMPVAQRRQPGADLAGPLNEGQADTPKAPQEPFRRGGGGRLGRLSRIEAGDLALGS